MYLFIYIYAHTYDYIIHIYIYICHPNFPHLKEMGWGPSVVASRFFGVFSESHLDVFTRGGSNCSCCRDGPFAGQGRKCPMGTAPMSGV